MIRLAAALFFVLVAYATVGAIDLAEERRLSPQGFIQERVGTDCK